MPSITLYLDREAIRVMREHAAAAGMPYSRWVAALIRRQSKAYWRPEITSIFGAHIDMPNPGPPVFETSVPDGARRDGLPVDHMAGERLSVDPVAAERLSVDHAAAERVSGDRGRADRLPGDRLPGEGVRGDRVPGVLGGSDGVPGDGIDGGGR